MSITANIFGRLTRDPEQKQSQSGNSYVNVAIAVNHGKDQQGQDQTTFVDLSAYGKTGELIMKNCHKGARINALATIRLDKYTTQQGQPGASLRGNVQNIDIVDWPDQQQQAAQQQYGQAPQQQGQQANYGTPPQQQTYGQPPQQQPTQQTYGQPPQQQGAAPWQQQQQAQGQRQAPQNKQYGSAPY